MSNLSTSQATDWPGNMQRIKKLTILIDTNYKPADAVYAESWLEFETAQFFLTYNTER